MPDHVKPSDWKRLLVPEKPSPEEERTVSEVKAIREELRQRPGVVEIPDLKAANRHGTPESDQLAQTTVPWRRLVDQASVTEASGRLLFRVATAVGAGTAIEVGTCLGISSSWIAAALARDADPKMVCLDGAPNLLAVAQQNVERVGGFKAELRPGLFSDTVAKAVAELDVIDFAYVDGEHFYEPTIRDAHLLLPKLRDGGAIVFDDIGWNAEMQMAWRSLANHPLCALAIEPRHCGSRCFGVIVKGDNHHPGRIVVVDDFPVVPQWGWSVVRRIMPGRALRGARTLKRALQRPAVMTG